MKKIGIIITAGGSGLRMGSDFPKQFMMLNGRPILIRTVELFAALPVATEIYVVLPPLYIGYWSALILEHDMQTPHTVVEGGLTRFHSVRNALALIETGGLTVVHDGVRPLASQAFILRMFEAAKTHPAVVPAVEVNESMRRFEGTDSAGAGSAAAARDTAGAGSVAAARDGVGSVSVARGVFCGATAARDGACSVSAARDSAGAGGASATRDGAGAGSVSVDRSQYRLVQTPQIFWTETLKQAYRQSYLPSFTDDASVVERTGTPLYFCKGERRNIKITTPEDLELAESLTPIFIHSAVLDPHLPLNGLIEGD